MWFQSTQKTSKPVLTTPELAFAIPGPNLPPVNQLRWAATFRINDINAAGGNLK